MTEPTADRIAKLPAWARDHIQQLTKENTALTEQLARQAPLNDEQCHLEPVMFAKGNRKYALPAEARIQFKNANPTRQTIWYDYEVYRTDTGTLSVRTIGGRLVVHPSGANSIEVLESDY